jgi:hypothetical protein
MKIISVFQGTLNVRCEFADDDILPSANDKYSTELPNADKF